MRMGEAETIYVFGWTWWPFDGAVTAAIIAAIATGIAAVVTTIINGRRFATAETNQTNRHTDVIGSTAQLSGREQLLIDLRRAEDALATDVKKSWIFAGVLLQETALSPYATDDDRRRAREIIARYKKRVSPEK